MTEAELFALLNASGDTDILEHFPRKYQDLRETPEQNEYQDQQEVVIFGRIGKLSFVRSPMSVIRLEIKTSTASYNCAIFNQPFYARLLHSGKKILVIANYKVRTKSFIVKTILNEDSPYLRSRIRPIYALPKHVSQQFFSSCVDRILTQRSLYVHEILPASLRDKYRLESRLEAFKDVHQPENFEALKRGIRVFKYEEALKYCLYTSIIKERRSAIKKVVGEELDEKQLKAFIAHLPYSLTSDQRRSVEEITADLASDKIMYRLLQGDVGTGKTLVAMLALFANSLRGGQGALLAPTMILAEQHFASAKKLLANTNLKIALLTTRAKVKEKRAIIQGLLEGSIDIIIGTHSILSEKLTYKNLSLAIIDEQQNFGVEQRNSLINKGLTTDLLMMTATPIPRTLTKVINADMDVSTLVEFPNQQRAVTSRVVQSVDPIISRAIKRALSLHRQIFVVAPKIVETESGSKVAVETVYAQMARDYGEENVQILHGKIKEDERTAIYADFVSGKKLILVATSIVEVGLDIQRACLMIIYSANTFGLSSLHQLRGRIGRSGENALALLVYDGEDEDAISSLKFLAEHDDGFKIAEYDLAHRGSGTLSGTKQSGDSDLQVANFVSDRKIFELALSDAKTIMSNLSDQSFYQYYAQIYKSLDDYNFD